MLTNRPRLLLARPDHLGDVLLSLPAAGWLRSLLPDAFMAALVSPPLASIVDRCPAIDETLTAPFPPPMSDDVPTGWEMAIQQVVPLLTGRFDIALLPRIDDPWSGALVAAAGIRHRIGFDHPRTRRFLTTALPLPRSIHVSRLALRVAAEAVQVAGLPVPADQRLGSAPWVVPTAADDAAARSQLNRVGLAGSQPLIVIHPGSGWPLKSWPLDRWASVVRLVNERWGIRSILTGGAVEKPVNAAIVERSDGTAIDFAGALDLGGLAALYRAADLVIAMDSGPLHLATAVGTPVVGIYGPAGADEFGPLAPADQQRVVRATLPCSPCRTMIAPPCGATAEPACLLAVTPEQIVAAASALLGNG